MHIQSLGGVSPGEWLLLTKEANLFFLAERVKRAKQMEIDREGEAREGMEEAAASFLSHYGEIFIANETLHRRM